jgi:hypothetical protein
LGQHAAGGEAGVAEPLELVLKAWPPAEARRYDLHQRFLHIVVRSTVERQAAGPEPGRPG